MKKLRLLGLSFALLCFALAQTPPVLAACTGRCTSHEWCRNCTGIPDSYCLGGYCAF